MLGRPTSAINDSADWLATVDRFGIVSERAVLLDQLTVIQNLAMPFTLDIEPPSGRRARARGGAGARGRPAGGVVGRAGRAARCRPGACASGSGARLRSIRRSCCSSTSAPGRRARTSAALGADISAVAAGRGAALRRGDRPTKRSPGRWPAACLTLGAGDRPAERTRGVGGLDGRLG